MKHRTIIENKLSTLLTMASQVDVSESRGVFWCHGPSIGPEEGEPPFTTMLCVPTLLRMIASHKDILAELQIIAEEPDDATE